MQSRNPSLARSIAVALLLTALVAGIAAFGTLFTIPHVEGWYASVNKVAWTPPSWLFAPAWTVLYVLIAAAGWLVWRSGHQGPGMPQAAKRELRVYALQLLLNAAWTPLFFGGFEAFGKAAWWVAAADMLLLIVVAAWFVVTAWKWSRTASLLFVPYLVWLSYAASLNLGVIALN